MDRQPAAKRVKAAAKRVKAAQSSCKESQSSKETENFRALSPFEVTAEKRGAGSSEKFVDEFENVSGSRGGL